MFNVNFQLRTGSYGTALPPGSFRGGYCFLANDDNLVTINNDGSLSKWDTAHITKQSNSDTILPIWSTPKLQGVDEDKGVYLCSVLPVGSATVNVAKDLFWILLSTDASNPMGLVKVYQVRVFGDGSVQYFPNTLSFPDQCNNISITADADGLYIVTSSTSEVYPAMGKVIR